VLHFEQDFLRQSVVDPVCGSLGICLLRLSPCDRVPPRHCPVDIIRDMGKTVLFLALAELVE
jgi:hypothetical protein